MSVRSVERWQCLFPRPDDSLQDVVLRVELDVKGQVVSWASLKRHAVHSGRSVLRKWAKGMEQLFGTYVDSAPLRELLLKVAGSKVLEPLYTQIVWRLSRAGVLYQGTGQEYIAAAQDHACPTAQGVRLARWQQR